MQRHRTISLKSICSIDDRSAYSACTNVCAKIKKRICFPNYSRNFHFSCAGWSLGGYRVEMIPTSDTSLSGGQTIPFTFDQNNRTVIPGEVKRSAGIQPKIKLRAAHLGLRIAKNREEKRRRWRREKARARAWPRSALGADDDGSPNFSRCGHFWRHLLVTKGGKEFLAGSSESCCGILPPLFFSTFGLTQKYQKVKHGEKQRVPATTLAERSRKIGAFSHDRSGRSRRCRHFLRSFRSATVQASGLPKQRLILTSESSIPPQDDNRKRNFATVIFKEKAARCGAAFSERRIRYSASVA